MRRQASTAQLVAAYARDGVPRGEAYRPLLTVRTPSRGQLNRVVGRATGRTYHFLSKLEADCFYLVDWCDAVVDVREQFPLLPLEETVAIARDLGVAPPAPRRGASPIVMTTDMVVTVSGRGGDVEREEDQALAVKPSSALDDGRTLEKLEIERRYWAARGVRWGMVTERELPATVVENVRWAAARRDLHGLGLDLARVARVIDALYVLLVAGGDTPLAEVCAGADDMFGAEVGTALTLVRHAIATKRWAVDLERPITPASAPLRELRRVARATEPADVLGTPSSGAGE